MQTHTKDQYLNNARARRHFAWRGIEKAICNYPKASYHTCCAIPSLAMTMRYAHMAPDHLQEAKTLNPLARLKIDTLLTQ